MRVTPTILKLPPDFPIRKWDPSRPLNRRAIDGARIVAGKAPKWSPADDPYVLLYADYLRLVRTGEQGTQPLPPDFAAIKAAHELAKKGGPRRWEIEARLVSGQSDSEIAVICGLSPEVISWFEALHFSVRESLKAWAYIQMRCVGPGRWNGFRADEVPQFWRWAALAAGPLMLDRLVAAFHANRKPSEAATLAVYLRDDADVAGNIQAFAASAVLPHHGPVGTARTEINLLMREADTNPEPYRRAFLRERSQRYIVCCARAFLAGMPLPKIRRPLSKATKRDAGMGSKTATGSRGAMPTERLLQTTVDDLAQSRHGTE